LEVERKKKNSREKKLVNIRPGIFKLEAEVNDDIAAIDMLLQNNNDGNVKPEEVMALIVDKYPKLTLMSVHRMDLYALNNDKLLTPMEV